MKVCINCDDFGLSPSVDRGALEAAEQGLVSSCSIMPYAADEENVKLLGSFDNMSVGLHFSLTTLHEGKFAGIHSIARLTASVLSGSLSYHDIAEELDRQYGIFKGLWTGKVSHIDTHHHVHVIPLIRKAVHDFAGREGIPHVRNPRETSYRVSLKKAMVNLGFAFSRQDIPFWGLSFMGRNFTRESLLRQFDYLERRGIDQSIWMVHVGYAGDKNAHDAYNQEREVELEVLKDLSEEMRRRFDIVSLWRMM